MHQQLVSFAPPGTEPHYSPICSPPQAPQQPSTVLQQLPAAPIMPPGSTPSIRPAGGHVKEDSGFTNVELSF
ncbi:hypothetical protein INR49_017886 [Caranx melampygus]|nr:hypothetical protein INR49_017886 [Caranx melampygus]